MFLALKCTTIDIITEYMFGQPSDALNIPDFKAPVVMNIQTALLSLWIIKDIPYMIIPLALAPRWLTRGIHDRIQAHIALVDYLTSELKGIVKEKEYTTESEDLAIFHRLLQGSGNHSAESFSKEYIPEALTLIHAGSDTVANACTVGTCHILKDDKILSRLTDDLCSIWADTEDDIELSKLEQLPYLVRTCYFMLDLALIKKSSDRSHKGISSPFVWCSYTTSAEGRRNGWNRCRPLCSTQCKTWT